MPKEFACALTHVRHESFFLDRWIAHYSAIVGRENLFVVIDGDDWHPEVDLSGITVETVLDAPRRRIRNDRWIAKEMSVRANGLRRRYAHVIRGDVDEYVVIDPASRLDWPEALEELGEDGYIFAMGIDVVQAPEEDALDRGAAILGQRRRGISVGSVFETLRHLALEQLGRGAHRLLNREVRLSRHFFLFHMALADAGIAQERMAARGGADQHNSHLGHQQLRLDVLDEVAAQTEFPFEAALDIARAEFGTEPDGTPATRPRAATVEGASKEGLLIRIPGRFHGLV